MVYCCSNCHLLPFLQKKKQQHVEEDVGNDEEKHGLNSKCYGEKFIVVTD